MTTTTTTAAAIATLRRGTETITFTKNDDGTVTVDEGDGMPATESAAVARTIWNAYRERGWSDGTAKADIVQQSASRLYHGIAASTNGGGGDAVSQKLESLQAAAEMASGAYVMLVYDIPTSKNHLAPNPSRMLWRHGFRLNFSCWVLPAKELENEEIAALLDNWAIAGIKHYVIEYAESQMEVVRKIAAEKIDEELRRIHGSLIACIDSADQALKAAIQSPEWQAMDADARRERENYRCAAIRSRINLAVKEFAAALACAEMYDATERLADLLAGVRAAIRSRQEAFAITASLRGIKAAAETV
jgi:hypothetical protein